MNRNHRDGHDGRGDRDALWKLFENYHQNIWIHIWLALVLLFFGRNHYADTLLHQATHNLCNFHSLCLANHHINLNSE